MTKQVDQLKLLHFGVATVMFTGIVQGTGLIVSLDSQPNLVRVGIAVPEHLLPGIQQGASICIDGVCLTVVRQDAQVVFFDIVAETLSRTTLTHLHLNQTVNIERALKMGDELGGHLLSGHVMGTANLIAKSQPTPEQAKLAFTCPLEWQDFILPKGFIGINGASLTVVDAGRGGFSVHLIPETLRTTNLGMLQIGDAVNIEIDYQTQVLVQTVKQYLSNHNR